MYSGCTNVDEARIKKLATIVGASIVKKYTRKGESLNNVCAR